MTDFKGIYVALLTPMMPDERLDEDSLRNLIRVNIQKGVKGFYAAGSTAEAFLLTIEERERIIQITCEECKGKALVIAQVGNISTESSCRLAKFAQMAGADAISSVAPFYYKFSFDEILSYYRQVTESVSIPMFVYNFPASSGVNLTMDQISQLFQIPNVEGIKFTAGDMFLLERIKHRFPDKYLFNGYDEMCLAGLVSGADGAIGSTYNNMAEKFIALYHAVAVGDLARAQEIQHEANNVIETMIMHGVAQSEKELLVQQNIIRSAQCRRPYRKLSTESKAALSKLLSTLVIEE